MDKKVLFVVNMVLVGALITSLVMNVFLYIQLQKNSNLYLQLQQELQQKIDLYLQLQREIEELTKKYSFLSNSITLNNTQHIRFIPRSWMETPKFDGTATGFLHSWVTLENDTVVPHDGVMVFLWENYSYRLFDRMVGDVYFTTEDARDLGMAPSSQRPFYLVHLKGIPEPYSRGDIAITDIQILEGSEQYPFVSGELAESVIPAWNEIEARYSSEIDSVLKELNKVQYNTVKVFVRPFWFESDRTLGIAIQKVTYYEGWLEWYIPPIYLLTVCFMFNNYGEHIVTYIVPPSMVAHF